MKKKDFPIDKFIVVVSSLNPVIFESIRKPLYEKKDELENYLMKQLAEDDDEIRRAIMRYADLREQSIEDLKDDSKADEIRRRAKQNLRKIVLENPNLMEKYFDFLKNIAKPMKFQKEVYKPFNKASNDNVKKEIEILDKEKYLDLMRFLK